MVVVVVVAEAVVVEAVLRVRWKLTILRVVSLLFSCVGCVLVRVQICLL